MIKTAYMPKKSNKPEPSAPKRNDRHKPSKQSRVRKSLVAPLEELAERNATSFPEEVNRAVREYLERNGLWPYHRSKEGG